MSRIYKTTRGKMIDIDQVKLANETAIAVGNMKINARGDKLGPGGTIISGRNEVMDRAYAVDTNTGYSPSDQSVIEERANMIENQKAQALSNLANSLVNQVTEEEAANVDKDISTEPATRGSLASSVAKTTTVVQQPMPHPKDVKKSNGPTRI